MSLQLLDYIYCLIKTDAGRLVTVSKCLLSVTALKTTKNAESECFHQGAEHV